MIRRIAEQWDEVEEGIRPVGSADTDELRAILGQIGGVRDALRTMCRVSVTRTSLKNAVREALLPVIQEHRDELFPEVVELRRRLAAADDDPSVLDVYRVAAQGVASQGVASQGEADVAPGNDDTSVAAAAAAAGEELRQRLASFEARLAQLDSTWNSDRQAVDGRVERVETGLAQVGSSVEHQVGAFREKVTQVEANLGRVRENVGRVEENVGRVEANVGRIETQLGGVETQLGGVETKVGRVEESLGSVAAELGRVEENLGGVAAELGRVEASIPHQAKAAADDVEARLRQEIREMVEQLTKRLADLEAILVRVEETVPTKGMLAAVDARLERLEATFARVSTQVDSIDAATPEVRALGERFREVRELIGQSTDSLREAGEGVGAALEGALGSRLSELDGVLRDGISRWESDQSQTFERMTSLRDVLRDQLSEFSRQVDEAQGSIWGKLTGKKEPGLKLSATEFDAVSEKLEGIISGLERLIAKRVDRPGSAPA